MSGNWQTVPGGSSPRIRGESVSSDKIGGAVGIIPANTGRMGTDAARHVSTRDHPREYGENAPWMTVNEAR